MLSAHYCCMNTSKCARGAAWAGKLMSRRAYRSSASIILEQSQSAARSSLSASALRKFQDVCRAHSCAGARAIKPKSINPNAQISGNLFQRFQRFGNGVMRPVATATAAAGQWTRRMPIALGSISRQNYIGAMRTGAKSVSYIPRGSGLGENTVLYVLCGLNVLGTLVWVADEATNNRYRSILQDNLCVWGYGWKVGNNLSSFVASNFSNMNLLSGIFTTVILYSAGLQAIARGGPRLLLSTYVLGGTFSQLCQVFGPVLAERANFPSVLQVHGRIPTDGASGACLSLLTWYTLTYPRSQIALFMIVPVPVSVFGALYLGGVAYTLVTNGSTIPLLGGAPWEMWRTMGGIAAGTACAFLATRRPGMLRRKFY